jgi:hypothetical protein
VPRVWLWLVALGVFLIVLGGLGWLSGSTPWWYVLLGVTNLMVGLSMRPRNR